MSLEVLHFTLMLLRGGACLERAQIATSLRLRVEFSGIQPIFARAEFPYHIVVESTVFLKVASPAAAAWMSAHAYVNISHRPTEHTAPNAYFG
jgi:hypothetical protein